MTDGVPFRCIRCGPDGRTGDPSAEHVFPYAIGGALTVPDLCKPCNDIWGAKFDAPLVDHFMIQMKRHRFGIAGHDGHVPDPLGAPAKAADDLDIRVQLQPEGGLRILPSGTRTIREDGSETRTLLFDQRDPKDKDEAVRRLVQRALRRGQEVRVTENPTRQVRSKFQLTQVMARDWAFGLMKIGYELAYLVAGRAWLDDEAAVRLRSFLRHGEPTLEHLASSGIEARLDGFGMPHDLPPWKGLEEWNHYGGVMHEDGRLIAEIRVFETLGAKIVVSRVPGAYAVPKPGVTFGLDARTREVFRFDGHRLTRLSTRNNRPPAADDQPPEQDI